MPSTSKIPPERVDTPPKVLELGLEFAQCHETGLLPEFAAEVNAPAVVSAAKPCPNEDVDGNRTDGRALDYRHAVYAGSFDPITLGHTAIIERASRLYEQVTLAIGFNPKKASSGLFTVEERLALLRHSVKHLPNVHVEAFSGLLIHFCTSIGAGVIVRGLRVLTDFEYEFQLGLANRDLEPRIETTFLLTEHEHVYISSSLVKEIAANQGEVRQYVSEEVATALERKYPPED